MRYLPNRQAIASISKYLALGLLVFAIGLVWNFPYERLKDSLTAMLTKQTGYQFDMDELSPALPLGFIAKGARISGPPVSRVPVNLEFERLRVTTSPLLLPIRLLQKKIALSFVADQEKYSWTGKLGLGKTTSYLELETDDFRMNQTFPMGEMSPMLTGSDLKVVARAKFSVRVEGETPALQRGDLSKADGTLTLEAEKVAIDPPMVKELRFEKVSLAANLEQGKLDIKSIQLTGPDINGSGSGNLKIQSFLPRSQLQLEAKVTITEKARELRDLAATFGNQIGLRINDQGTAALKINGPLNRLRVRGY